MLGGKFENAIVCFIYINFLKTIFFFLKVRTYVFENIKTKTNHNPNGPNNPEFSTDFNIQRNY